MAHGYIQYQRDFMLYAIIILCHMGATWNMLVRISPSATFLGVYHKNRFVIYIYILCSILIFVTVVTVVTLVYIPIYTLGNFGDVE
jgi:hypothetical protein